MSLDVLRIPVVGATAVVLRFSPLPRTGDFRPDTWSTRALTRTAETAGEWWQVDLAQLGLADGAYEYDFRVERAGQVPFFAPDPYAEELTRFGGYRGVFQMASGHRLRLPFDWQGEIAAGSRLPDNNEIVLYELPMRWVDSSPDAGDRQVGLGTFDKALFERLADWLDLGINAIELLPVQDSPDTLNWGYGTRFFWAPDIDMGEPVDLKLFVKACHARGVRVILDVVMNHSRGCPLEGLARDMFYLADPADERGADGEPRNAWGGALFRYRQQAFGAYHARNLQLGMAEFWIKEFHVDGFRIDEFKGIDNWDFIRAFRDRAWQVQQATFPGRPFIVIAEDSWRRPHITQDLGGGKTVDAAWDFDFRDEVRRLAANHIQTAFGEPSRAERVRALISGRRVWDDGRRGFRQRAQGAGTVEVGFDDMAQRIAYVTSHDVENFAEQRLYPFFVEMLQSTWRSAPPPGAEPRVDVAALEEARAGLATAFAQIHACFALMLTTVGIPMFLAGEEFADLHDLPHDDWRLKMSDPVDWQRAALPGHTELRARVRELVRLRGRHRALQRNEVEFFGMAGGFHPAFDGNDGPRVFAYCRSAGQPLGSPGQVIVVANAGPDDFPGFTLAWPWGATPLVESGGVGQPLPAVNGTQADLALRPFQVRVLST
jgi:1,4-alpha-glucan branching enzyme